MLLSLVLSQINTQGQNLFQTQKRTQQKLQGGA